MRCTDTPPQDYAALVNLIGELDDTLPLPTIDEWYSTIEPVVNNHPLLTGDVHTKLRQAALLWRAGGVVVFYQMAGSAAWAGKWYDEKRRAEQEADAADEALKEAQMRANCARRKRSEARVRWQEVRDGWDWPSPTEPRTDR